MYEAEPREGTSLDSAISEMEFILADFPNLADLIATIKTPLIDLREKYSNGAMTAGEVCAFLFDLYFHLQSDIQDTEIAHILRVVGHDFGRQNGVDDDRTWDLYEESMDKDHRDL